MSAPGKSGNKYRHSDQERDNNSHDDTWGVNVVELVGENAAGDALLRVKVNADGSLSTTGSDGLTDAELRATPVPVSGTVTATPTGTQNVDVTANTIGLATSTKQDTIIGHVDGIETLVGTTNTNTTDLPNVIGTDGAAGPTKAISVGGTRTTGELEEIRVDADGHLQIDVLTMPAGGSGLTDSELRATPVPVSGTVAVTQSGIWDEVGINDSGNSITVDDGGGSLTVDGTVAATQSGTWNVTNVSGTVSLPTGAATSANQTTVIGHLDGVEGLLTTIDADTGTLLTETATNYALKLDDTTTANVTYVGTAAMGSSGASAVWRIKKIDETSGLVITWADGNANFDNVWNNFASLSYS